MSQATDAHKGPNAHPYIWRKPLEVGVFLLLLMVLAWPLTCHRVAWVMIQSLTCPMVLAAPLGGMADVLWMPGSPVSPKALYGAYLAVSLCGALRGS